MWGNYVCSPPPPSLGSCCYKWSNGTGGFTSPNSGKHCRSNGPICGKNIILIVQSVSKTNGTVRKYFFIIWNLFQQYVYLITDIISKRNKCSFCCYLNHIFCFCKSRVMPRFMRWGKIPFVPLFVFIVEIVMKVSNNEAVFLIKKGTYKENIEINHRSIF